jgi:hypothetical protein
MKSLKKGSKPFGLGLLCHFPWKRRILTLNYGAIEPYCAIIRGVSRVFYPSTPPDHVISAMSLLRHEARSQVLVVPLLRSNGTVEPLEAKSAVFFVLPGDRRRGSLTKSEKLNFDGEMRGCVGVVQAIVPIGNRRS